MELVTRQHALAEGLRFYFTGRPCKRGHVAQRYAHNCVCTPCLREGGKKHRTTETYTRSRRKRYEQLYKSDPARFLYDRALGRARRRKIEFSLTAQDIRDIWPEDGRCPVFGVLLVPNVGEEGSAGKATPQSPSLDRVDVSKGYRPGNIAVISQLANSIKASATSPSQLRQVADWIEEIQAQGED